MANVHAIVKGVDSARPDQFRKLGIVAFAQVFFNVLGITRTVREVFPLRKLNILLRILINKVFNGTHAFPVVRKLIVMVHLAIARAAVLFNITTIQ